jgi:hypothetical protein
MLMFDVTRKAPPGFHHPATFFIRIFVMVEW